MGPNPIRARQGGGAAGPPVAIVGTPMSFPVGAPHVVNNSNAYDHPGGPNTGIAVIVAGKTSPGGAVAATITWDGVPVPVVIDNAGYNLGNTEAWVAIGVLPAAAAGAKALAVSFPSQSRSVVTILSLANLKQAGPTGAVIYNGEYVANINTIAAALTATAAASLLLAAAAIGRGTTALWSAPFIELFDTKSDAGTATTTLNQTGATASPAIAATVTATATFSANFEDRCIAVVELLAA